MLYGLGTDGVSSGLVALAGSGYVRLIGAEARRLGTARTAIVHAVGIAFVTTAFVLLFVTHGSDKVGIGLYLFVLAWSLGAAYATGSFGGVVATMALALVAMVHGIWGAAIASGVRDAGQAYIAMLLRAAVAGACSRDRGLWLVARRRPPSARKPWTTRIGGRAGRLLIAKHRLMRPALITRASSKIATGCTIPHDGA